MLKEKFTDQRQSGVVRILNEIHEALGRAYNLESPLDIKITTKKPTDLVIQNPVSFTLLNNPSTLVSS